MLSVLFKLFSSQHIFILTTTGTTITTHRSKTDLDLCHLCNLCELLYTNGLELTIKNYKFIFDNLWKFTGISVKYKTQIGTNDHKLSKILLLKPAGNYQFSIFNSQFNESRQANYPLSIVHYQLSIINCQKAATSRHRRSRRRRSRRHRPMRHGRRHRKSGWYCCHCHATSR